MINLLVKTTHRSVFQTLLLSALIISSACQPFGDTSTIDAGFKPGLPTSALTPKAPEVTSTVVGDQKVKLVWTAPEYKLSSLTYSIRRLAPGETKASVVASGLTQLEFIDSGLTNGGTYTYAVFASTEKNGDGPDSIPLELIPQAGLISFTTPANNSFVNLANHTAITLSGSCSPSGKNVVFTSPASWSAPCVNGAWSLIQDFSSVDDANAVTLTAAIPDAFDSMGPDVSWTLVKDTVVPVLTMDAPTGSINTLNVSAFTVSGTCVGADDQTLSIKLGSAVVAQPVCSSGSFSANINFSSAADGAVALNLDGSDAAGNPALQATQNFNKDLNSPAVTIASPANNSFVNIATESTFTISGSCTENSRDVSVELSDGTNTVAPSTAPVCDTSATPRWSTTVDTSSLAASFHIQASQVSATGNPGSSTVVNITKDLVRPVLAFSAPAANTAINLATQNAFSISGSCSENGRTVSASFTDGTLTVAGSVACNTSATPNYTITADLHTLSDTSSAGITASISQSDVAGNNSNSTVRTLNKDSIAPSIAISAPSNNSFINIANDSATFAVSGTCSEASQAVVVKVDGSVSGAGATCDGTNFSATIDSTALTPGAHTLTATIADTASNSTTSATINFTRDVVAPTIAITSPANNSYINSTNDSATFAVTGTCSEASQSVVIKVDGATNGAGATCDGTNFSATIDSTALSQSAHTITATIVDAASNSTTSTTINVSRDIVLPVLVITAPASPIYSANKTSYTISGTCVGLEDTRTVTLKYGSTVVATPSCSSGAFSATGLDLSNNTTYPEGLLSITADATDAAGNVAVQVSRNFTKDITLPVLAITAPSSPIYSANKTNYTISGTCVGLEDTRTVTLKYGSTTVASPACSSGAFSGTGLDLSNNTTYPDGTLSITADATDAAGNVATQASQSFTKDTTLPTVAISSPAANAYILDATKSAFAITGSCSENGRTVSLSITDGSHTVTGSATCATGSSPNWTASLDVTTLNETTSNSITLSVGHTDAAGNVATTATRTFNKDTVLPAAPVITGPTPMPYYSSDSSITVVGTCETGNVVSLGGGGSGSATCASSTFSIATTQTTNATYAITAIQTDNHGNPSVNSNSLSWIKEAPATKLTLATAGAIPMSTCTAITVAVQNASSTAAHLSAATDVALSGAGLGGGFYADSSCATATSTLTLAANATGGTFYFKTTKTAARTFTAAATGLTSGTLTPTLNAGAATQILFALQPSSGLINQAFNPGVIVTIADANGNVVTSGADATANVTISLKSGSTGTLSGTATVAAVNGIADFTSSALMVNLRGTKTLTATKASTAGSGGAGALSVDSAAFLIDANAYKLVYSASPTTITAGSCSSIFTIQVQDSGSTNTVAQSDIAITLAGQGSGGFYSDSSCASSITTRSITAGNQTASFYYKSNTRAEVVTLTSSASSLVAASGSYTIAAPSPSKIVLSGTTSINAATCSSFTITSKNTSDVATNVSANTTVNLTGGGNGRYYSDSGCTAAITSTTISSGTSSKTIYFKDLMGESATLGANATMLDPTTLAVTVSAAALSSYALSGPSTATTDCSGPWTVTNKNSSGTATNVGSNSTVNIGGGGAGTFYSDSSCATSATSIVIASGTSAKTFYYKGYGVEALIFTAKDPSAAKAGSTLAVTVTPIVISSSGNYSMHCSVLSSGRLTCSGSNDSYQLGIGSSDTSLVKKIPQTVISSGASKVAVSNNGFACALLTSGTVKCWGYGYNYHLGNGDSYNQSSPVTVSNITNAVDISVSDHTGCAVLSTGTIKCWGYGYWGALGSNSYNWSYAPTPINVDNITTATAVTSGSQHSCALLSSGGVKCWGDGGSGQLGNSIPNNYYSSPQDVTGLSSGVSSIAASRNATCARLSTGSIKCWGAGGSGQLGNGNTNNQNSPVSVTGITTAAELSSSNSSYHVCVRLSDNTVKCWGSGYSYALGVAQGPNDSSTPVTVTGYTGTAAGLGLGLYFTCIRISGGGEKCIGRNNYGQIGDGTTTNPTTAFSDVLFSFRQLNLAGVSTLPKLTCSPFTLTQLANGSAGNFPTDATVSLASTSTGSAAITYYSDAGCSSSITSIAVLGGEASRTIYLKSSNGPGVSTLLASSNGFIASANTVNISGAPTNFELANATGNVNTNQCAQMSITIKDTLNQIVPLVSNLTLDLSDANYKGNHHGVFYADSECLTAPITSVILPAGSSTGSVYYKDDHYENMIVTASDQIGSLSSAGNAYFNIGNLDWYGANPDPWPNFSFLTGACTKISFQPTGAPVDTSWNIDNSYIGDNYTGAFTAYSDSDCTTVLNPIILSGSNRTTFYLKSNFDSGWYDTYFWLTSDYGNNYFTNWGSGSTSSLNIWDNSGNSTSAGSCHQIWLAPNVVGNQTGIFGPALLDYSTTSSGGHFYKDSRCQTAMSSGYTNYDGNNSGYGYVYYRDTESGNPTLTFSSSGVTFGTMSLSVGGGSSAPAQLALSGPANVDSGSCSSAYTVTVQDVGGTTQNVASNTTILLSGKGLGSFYADSSCTSATSSISIASGTSSQVFYFMDSHAEALSLSASGYVLHPSSLNVTIAAGSNPTHLAINGSSSITTADCATYIFEARNASEALANVDTNQTIVLSGLGHGAFYSSSNCTSQVSSATIASGTSSKTLYFKDMSAETLNMMVSNTSLGSANKAVGVVSSTGYALTLTGVAQGQKSSCLGPMTIGAVDSSGASYTAPSNQTLALSANTAGTFYSDSGCSSLITQVTMNSGSSSAQFYFKDANAEKSTLTVVNATSNWAAASYDVGTNPFAVTQIAIGPFHGCLVNSAGAVLCWGSNGNGQLGDNTTTNRSIPTQVSGLTSGVAMVAVGIYHSCALLNTGAVKCWGLNGYGQLGDGSTTNRTTPVDVSGLSSGVTDIKVNPNYSACALLNTGAVKCWGHNGYGQLGDGSQTLRSTPVTPTGLTSGVSSISLGSSSACAVMTSGGLKCWGYNSNGMFSSSGAGGYLLSPTDISVSGSVSAVALASNTRCTLLSTGAVKCQGYGGDGQLGNDSTTTSYTSVSATGLNSGVSNIFAGDSHFCALLSTGDLKCWGYNGYGQLGVGDFSNKLVPTLVASDVSKYAGSSYSSCYITNSSQVSCYGYEPGSGGLGFGTQYGYYSLPVNVNYYSRKYELANSASITFGVCTAVTLTETLNGSATSFHREDTVALSSSSTALSFYSDSNCTQSISTLKTPVGQTSISYYVKATDFVSGVVIQAEAAYINAGRIPNITIAGQAANLVLVDGTTTPTVNECTPYVIQYTDSNGSPAVPYDHDSSINFYVNYSFNWSLDTYSDPECNSSAQSLTIPAGENTGVFYVRTWDFGASEIYVYDNNNNIPIQPVGNGGGWWGSSYIELDVGGFGSVSYWIDVPSEVVWGQCLPITINQSGALVNDNYLYVYTNYGNTNLFSDSSCSSWSNGVTIPAGQTQATMYISAASNYLDYIYLYRDYTNLVYAESNLFSTGWYNYYISGNPYSIGVNGSCTTVEMDLNAGVPFDLYFSIDNSSAAGTTIYSDANCSTVGDPYIPQGSSSLIFSIDSNDPGNSSYYLWDQYSGGWFSWGGYIW